MTKSDGVDVHKASDVQMLLELNNMFQQDKEAYAKCPALKKLVDSILGRERVSPMAEKTCLKLKQICEDNVDSTEWVFLVPFITKLIADQRIVETKELERQIATSEEWISQEWDDQKLRPAYAAPFDRTCIPELRTSNKVQQQMLKQFPRIATPVPDVMFGLHRAAFSGEHRQINGGHLRCVEVAEKSVHSFFLAECKTKGEFADAINQACRGGAALVNARRLFNSLAEPHAGSADSNAANSQDQPSYADLQSIAFSMKFSPLVAWVYVHWAEIDGVKPVRFHMNRVVQHGLVDEDGKVFTRLRRHINNIF